MLKRFIISGLIFTFGLFCSTFLNPASAAEEKSPLENNIVLCAENGAPLTKLSGIQANTGSATTALPVPQIGATLEVADKVFKVTKVDYVYGTVSIYCIKVFVAPVE